MIDIEAWQSRQAVQNRVLQTVPCAVLVPVVKQEGEDCFLLEVRSPHLGWQPGDICFPGGRIEETDASPWEAALRETQEELGIERTNISLLGPLDYVESPVGVLVWPYAAAVSDGSAAVNTEEVEKTLLIPVSWFEKTKPETAFMDMATRPAQGFPEDMCRSDSCDWVRRKPYRVFIYRYGENIIWGITAQIIRNFLDIRSQMTK